MFVSIGQAAVLIGVSISTLRRWEEEGKFSSSFRTCGGHRRYQLSDIKARFLPDQQSELQRNKPTRKAVAYARVSSHDQKLDLERQIKSLACYCKTHKLSYKVISDLGSGLNCNKRGLNQLLQEICLGQVSKLVLTHKDRLLRFGSPLLFKLCQFYETEVVILQESASKSFEEELVGDVIEIMPVFVSKMYGKRSILDPDEVAAFFQEKQVGHVWSFWSRYGKRLRLLMRCSSQGTMRLWTLNPRRPTAFHLGETCGRLGTQRPKVLSLEKVRNRDSRSPPLVPELLAARNSSA